MEALTSTEIRVLGCLLEKAVTTPDQYPLTLNALVGACNQKSSRDPVMQLDPGEVQRTLRVLEDKLLVSTDPNRGGRVEKYSQRFCNTPFGVHQFETDEYAVLTVLLLRGPQTPGELRTRCDRLHRFPTNEDVAATLDRLRQREPDALVALLERRPGRRDAEWMHLLGDGEPPAVAAPTPHAAESPSTTHEGRATPTAAASPPSTGRIEDRLAALERRVERLEARSNERPDAGGALAPESD